jgi:hypothetical protein
VQIPIDVGHYSDLKPDSQGPFPRVSEGGIRPSSMNDEEDEMPAKRGLTMRQIRDLLRLSDEGCSVRDMALRYGVARSTIQDNLKRAKDAGLAWPLPADLTDDFLEKALFSANGRKSGYRRHPEPDWALLARELKRPGVTLSVLWEEYRQVHPEGYNTMKFIAGADLRPMGHQVALWGRDLGEGRSAQDVVVRQYRTVSSRLVGRVLRSDVVDGDAS